MKRKPAIIVLLTAFAIAIIFAFPGCEDKPRKSSSGVLSDIKSKGTLIVAAAGTMPPFNMKAGDGEVHGFEADLANKFAEFLGVKVQYEIMPFAQLLDALKDSRAHMVMSGMTITPERNVEVAFVGPYYVSSKAVLTKEKSVVAGTSMARFDDPRFKFAVLKGSTSQKFVEDNFPKAQLTAAEGYPEAVRMVLEDQVHALLADYPICAVTLMQYPEAGFYSDIVRLTYEPLGIAVPADDPHLINWLENTLATLEGDGTLKAIEEYWINDLGWISQGP